VPHAGAVESLAAFSCWEFVDGLSRWLHNACSVVVAVTSVG
jgi:hypothetical protein